MHNMLSPYVQGLIDELNAFDKRCKKPLPKLIYDWRNRWILAIERAKCQEKTSTDK